MREQGEAWVSGGVVLALILTLLVTLGLIYNTNKKARVSRQSDLYKLQHLLAVESAQVEEELAQEYKSMLESQTLCAVCHTPTKARCSRCKLVYYCSLTCQGEHWKLGHKLECRSPAPISPNVETHPFTDSKVDNGNRVSEIFGSERVTRKVSDAHLAENGLKDGKVASDSHSNKNTIHSISATTLTNSHSKENSVQHSHNLVGGTRYSDGIFENWSSKTSNEDAHVTDNRSKDENVAPYELPSRSKLKNIAATSLALNHSNGDSLQNDYHVAADTRYSAVTVKQYSLKAINEDTHVSENFTEHENLSLHNLPSSNIVKNVVDSNANKNNSNRGFTENSYNVAAEISNSCSIAKNAISKNTHVTENHFQDENVASHGCSNKNTIKHFPETIVTKNHSNGYSMQHSYNEVADNSYSNGMAEKRSSKMINKARDKRIQDKAFLHGPSISAITIQGNISNSKQILFPYDEFMKLFCWDVPKPPCGLINCGNSCFASVVLQCLTYTRPLAAYLFLDYHGQKCQRNDWCFMCELGDHVKRAFSNEDAFSPIRILSLLRRMGSHLGSGRQEDAHEFMRFVIDSMQAICLDEVGGEKVVETRSQETTPIYYIFGGRLQSQVKCLHCHHVSYSYEKMMDLAVEIQGPVDSLDGAFANFTAPESLDGNNKYKCDRCAAYVKAIKRLTLHEAPNVLTVTLKRFQSGKFGKLNKRVSFPQVLNISPYMSRQTDQANVYQLYAIIVHLDMLNSSFFGHYVCYVKDKDRTWYKIDDSKVMEVDVDKALSQNAYMLLYSRTSPRCRPDSSSRI